MLQRGVPGGGPAYGMNRYPTTPGATAGGGAGWNTGSNRNAPGNMMGNPNVPLANNNMAPLMSMLAQAGISPTVLFSIAQMLQRGY